MARSRRMAGGCSAPTEGKRPSGHGMVTTAISRVPSASAAMCTAPVSPHKPSSVQEPADSWLIARRQPSSFTTTRGHPP